MNAVDVRWRPETEPRGKIALLHGLQCLAATWWQIGPELAARGWDVVALDLPGHGTARRIAKPLDIGELTAGVLDRLDDDIDVLVGHSMGAPVALEILRQRPGRLRALVFEEPSDRADMPEENPAENVRTNARLAASNRDWAVREERQHNPSWHTEDVEQTVEGVLQSDSEAIATGFEQPGAWHTFERLGGTDLPILVLIGTEPRSTVRGNRRQQVRAAAVRVAELDGGHFLHRDRPGEWLAHVTAFLDSTFRDSTRASTH